MTLRRWADRGGSSSRSSRVALGFAWLAIVLVAASLLPHSAAAQPKSAHRTPRRARPGGRERLDRKCERRYGCDGGIVQDVPHDITHAAAEVRLEDGSIADVVLFRGTDAAVAVEILVTHAVGSQKAERLSVPWMELLAVDVLD